MERNTHLMSKTSSSVRNDHVSGKATADAVRFDGWRPPAAGGAIGQQRKQLLYLSLLLVVTILIVYHPVKDFGFLEFDDQGYVTGNIHVTGGLTWNNIRWAFTTSHMSNWHPLTWLSHMADGQFFGFNAGAHHQTSMIIHMLNSVLLLFLLYRMTGALWKSAFVAALFALHPLHVESVAWISERKDLLSTCFGFLALHFYLPYAREKRDFPYVLSLACFTLSLMAKPMMVTLPFLLLLFDFWPLGRLPLSMPRTGEQFRKVAAIVGEKIPFICVSAVSCIMTVFAQRGGGALQSMDSFSLMSRVFNAVWAYWWYILKTLWPSQLAAYYPHPDYGLGPVQIFGSLLFLVGITYLVVRYARQGPYLFVGWFGYLGMLVPVIGLIQVGSQGMADRYSYVPLIGLFLIVAWGLPDLMAGRRHGKTILWSSGILALVVLGIVSARQVGHWRDTKTLYLHALSVTENNAVMLNSLGAIYTREGDLERGAAYLGRSLRLKPGFGQAHNDMGATQAKMGQVGKAAFHYRQAIRYDPHLALPHYNYAAILVRQKRHQAAMHHLSQAIRIDPNYANAYVFMGFLLMQSGNTEAARVHFHRALEINPAHVDARQLLSNME